MINIRRKLNQISMVNYYTTIWQYVPLKSTEYVLTRLSGQKKTENPTNVEVIYRDFIFLDTKSGLVR